MRALGLAILLSVVWTELAAKTDRSAGITETAAIEPAFTGVETEADRTAEIAAFNRSVTDAEIEAWLKFQFQYEPLQLADWNALSAADRAEAVSKYRQMSESTGDRLPVLRGRTPKELDELNFMAKLYSEQSISLRNARELLPRLDRIQHLRIRETCIELIAAEGAKARAFRNVETPPALHFLHPDLIRINRDKCWVFLQKGIGRGYGLEVQQVKGQWRLFWFDEHLSWERHEIKLD